MTPRRKPKPRAEKSPGGPGRKRRPAEKRDLVASMVFAIPFLSVAAINLRNTVALCAALFIILMPVSVLRHLLREQLSVPRWLSVPLCSMVALMLASLSYYLIRFVSVEITDALGTYLYLLAAYPVLAAASSEQDIDSVPSALRCALRYFFRFTCLGLVMALIREVLAYGQIWGIPLGYNFRVDGAKMTFFGLMLMGVLLAGVNQIRAWAAMAKWRRRDAASIKPL